MEITQEELVKKIEAAVAAALKQMQKQKADDDEEAAKKKEAAAKAKKEAYDAAAEKAKKEAEDAAKAKAATDPAKEAMEILGRIKAQQMQIAVEASQMVLARRLARPFQQLADAARARRRSVPPRRARPAGAGGPCDR